LWQAKKLTEVFEIYLINSNGFSTTFFLSTIYGISAVCLALLIATVTISWCLLQFPVNLLGMILNLSLKLKKSFFKFSSFCHGLFS